MPELPEVTTIVNQLNRKIKGKRIKKVEVRDAKAVNLAVKSFEKKLQNKKVIKAERRAKIIIWHLSGERYLVFHLKLNGRLLWVADSKEPKKHTRVIFDLVGPGKIFFEDTRRFAWVKYFNSKSFDEYLEKQNFGPEPLEKDFTLEFFNKMLKRRSRSKIKPLIMDQKFIAGIGNIYAQEACFYAGILPSRSAGSLKKKEIEKLYQGIIEILREATRQQGTSSDVYVDLYGKQGDYVEELKVYQREGEKCYRCGGTIKVEKLAGRGTRYCPKCQK